MAVTSFPLGPGFGNPILAIHSARDAADQTQLARAARGEEPGR